MSRHLFCALLVAATSTLSCSSEHNSRTATASESPAAPAAKAAAPAVAQAAAAQPDNLYEFEAQSLEGAPAPLSQYAGSVSLVVNVASQCGYTKQYAGLQSLHSRLNERGFQVLGFPSNEFGNQEPGDSTEIRNFCTQNFGVTFPLFAKCSTQPGAQQSPVYAYLEAQTQSVPNWNFCKYLVDRHGRVLAFFPSKVTPEDPGLLERIEQALAAN